MIERTLAIIKPDAVSAGKTGEIIGIIEKNGFAVERMSKCVLSQDRAHLFYHVHEGKPFFDELVDFGAELVGGEAAFFQDRRSDAGALALDRQQHVFGAYVFKLVLAGDAIGELDYLGHPLTRSWQHSDKRPFLQKSKSQNLDVWTFGRLDF